MDREKIRSALRELKELHKEGLLDEEEYQSEHRQLMSQWRRDVGCSGSGEEAAPISADLFGTGGVLPTQGGSLGVGVVLMERYQLKRLLGEGGMGCVFLARDMELGEDCAVKLIQPGLTADPEVRERFVQELRVTRQLTHPGIVRTHAMQKDPTTGQLFLTMEFLPGESLSTVLRDAGTTPLPVSRVLQVISRLAEILSYAHERGVIHRDLKPANVMMLPGDAIKLMDFGIAKLLVGDAVNVHTEAVGTAYYMAPEQLEGEEASPATDVFSLGVMAYQMLTGSLPIGVVENVSESHPDVSCAWDEILGRMMARAPSERYPSMLALLDALEGVNQPNSPVPSEELLGKLMHQKMSKTALRKDGWWSKSKHHKMAWGMFSSDDQTYPQEGLAFVEGVWQSPLNGTIYCAKMVNGVLFVPYCYEGDKGRAAHHHSCRRVGDAILTHFEWFARPIAGGGMLRIASRDRLVGGWWHGEDLPASHREDLTLLSATTPHMHESVWERVGSVAHFPSWAEYYFDLHAQKQL